jgi:hypothetical protein
MLYDITDRVSDIRHLFLVHPPLLNILQQSFVRIHYYVTEIREHAHPAAVLNVVLVGCKTDLGEKRQVTREEGQRLADELQFPFYEASAKENINVTEAFMKAAIMPLNSMPTYRFPERRGTTDRCYKDHRLEKCVFASLPEDDCLFCSVCRALITNRSSGAQCRPCSFYLCRGCLPVTTVNVTRNLEKTLSQVRLLANNNDARAQFDIGLCCVNGEGVEQNLEEAAKWFQRAADQNHAHAQFMLGKYYAEKTDMKTRHSKALAWFVRAADQKHDAAQNKLHKMRLTQLHFAVVRGNLDSVRMLLAQDAKVLVSANDLCASLFSPSTLSHLLTLILMRVSDTNNSRCTWPLQMGTFKRYRSCSLQALTLKPMTSTFFPLLSYGVSHV